MNSPSLRLTPLRGAELTPHIEALGQLRIAVFREFPYLYEGDMESERDYLIRYADSLRSLAVLVIDGEEVVGATTCLPLEDELPEFQEPFLKKGYSLESFCYFGESILLPAYRRKGIGKEFFRYREEHARSLGLETTAFCAVDRPADHTELTQEYYSLHGFWEKMGYERQPELVAHFSWREVGDTEDSPHALTFWTKQLRDAR